MWAIIQSVLQLYEEPWVLGRAAPWAFEGNRLTVWDSTQGVFAVQEEVARSLGLPVAAVQHHAAHLLACVAENAVGPPYAGIVWDGTGWGPDGTVWGGECFRCDGARVTRLGRFRPFPLPGGDAAVVEPRRSALAVSCGR